MTYGCHDRPPFIDGYEAQDGWFSSGPRRKVIVPVRAETNCQFTKSDMGQADPGCTACKHKQIPKENP